MAHTYIITRGVKLYVDQLIADLQARFLPFKYKGEDKVIRLGVRPIQLWELTYPKDCRDIVHTTLFGKNKGEPLHKKHSKFVWAIRKALGVDPISDYNLVDKELCLIKDNVDITAIGEKDDEDLLQKESEKTEGI